MLKFIDINTMIGPWRYKNLAFRTADDIIQEMDRLYITKAFTYHSLAQYYDPVIGNDMLLKEIKGKDRLIGTVVLTNLIKVEFGGEDKLRRYLSNANIGAIRIYPIDHSFTLDIWNVEELFSFTSRYSLPVLLDMQQNMGDLSSHFNEIYNLAIAFSKTPIILLATGCAHLRTILKLLEKCDNICLDTSIFTTYRGIEEVTRLFGSNRILFGSRIPFIEGGVSIGRIIYADISDEDKENIAFRNASRLLQNIRL